MIPQKHLSALEERFLRYVRIDSQSDEDSATVPSTAIQWALLRLLGEELQALGAADVVVTDEGFTIATIPASPGYENRPVVAFLAHVDTAPSFAASGVKPLVHRRWDGSPIILPDNPAQILDPGAPWSTLALTFGVFGPAGTLPSQECLQPMRQMCCFNAICLNS